MNKEYRKVPIAIVGGQQVLNGSDAIVDVLLQHAAVRERMILDKSPSFQGNWENFTSSSSSSEKDDWVEFANKDLSTKQIPGALSLYDCFGIELPSDYQVFLDVTPIT